MRSQELREIRDRLIALGRVDGQALEALRQAIYADGTVDRAEADLLAEVHKRVRPSGPAFEDFFYSAVKDHILADGTISAEETAWLEQLIFEDGKVDDDERRFLHRLKGEARQTCPEFEQLFHRAMREPPEQRTSGSQHR